MIYKKTNAPTHMLESLEVPVWANPSHAEEVRVDPSKARTVQDIMNRYGAGVVPREVDNGSPELNVETRDMTMSDADHIFDQPDFNSANSVDYNDHEYIQDSISQKIEESRSSALEVLRKYSESQKSE